MFVLTSKFYEIETMNYHFKFGMEGRLTGVGVCVLGCYHANYRSKFVSLSFLHVNNRKDKRISPIVFQYYNFILGQVQQKNSNLRISNSMIKSCYSKFVLLFNYKFYAFLKT